MSVRAATRDDIPAIVGLGELLHATSTYARYSFDGEKVGTLLGVLIGGDGVVFVADRAGEVVGTIAGGVTEFWFGHDVHGFDYSFFVHPEHRHGVTAFRLLLAFESWCRLHGATEMRIGITTGIELKGTTRFYEWVGYTINGTLFTKDLRHGN